jgi:hypothetical protein
MTQTVSRVRRRRPVKTGQQIHIPHSSWTRTDRAPENVASANSLELRPDEFWSRLGL